MGVASQTESARARTVSLDRDDLELHEDRFFDPDPSIRSVARLLYEETRDLPLICPHGHVEPRMLAENQPFPEPTALIVIPDHYIFRMLYSRGIPLESLGVPSRDGTVVEQDPRKIWQLFAENFYLFRGTPSGVWLAHELHEVFGVRRRLSARTAQAIYDEIAEKLASPEFRPRALFERFNIEVLTTTDAATDTLDHHRGYNGNLKDRSYCRLGHHGKNRLHVYIVLCLFACSFRSHTRLWNTVDDTCFQYFC